MLKVLLAAIAGMPVFEVPEGRVGEAHSASRALVVRLGHSVWAWCVPYFLRRGWTSLVLRGGRLSVPSLATQRRWTY